MCGIAGVLGRRDRILVERLTDAVSHRGPDARGVRELHAATLGHARLAIIDLSESGQQPMGALCRQCASASNAQITIVYNGELYNFRELRDELAALGHDVRTSSDTEIVLHAYGAWGVGALERLNGIFAFAIVDERVAGRPEGVECGDAFLVRDHFGVKPLLYAEHGGAVTFASELRALLVDRTCSSSIDGDAVRDLLQFLWVPGKRTILEGVRRVGAGELVHVRNGHAVNVVKYYDATKLLESRTTSEATQVLEERLDAALRTAVRRQMVADVEVGAFLSGGLDSSLLVALMTGLSSSRPVQCFASGVAEGESLDGAPNDLPYARVAAKWLGVELNELILSPSMQSRIAEMVVKLDEPAGDLAPLNTLMIAESARERGIKVLLSGAGGDDLFTGYRRHVAAYWQGRMGSIPGPLASAIGGAARRLERGGIPYVGGVTLVRRTIKALAAVGLDDAEQVIKYFKFLPDDVVDQVGGPLPPRRGVDAVMQSLTGMPAQRTPLERMLALELMHFLPDHNLLYTDRMSMAAGVEVRVPFLDRELVECAWEIPLREKISARETKRILRRVAGRYLPATIVRRPKSGFGVPLRRWLDGALGELFADALSDESVRRRGLFDVRAVRDLRRLQAAGSADVAYPLLAMMNLELWCRGVLDVR